MKAFLPSNLCLASTFGLLVVATNATDQFVSGWLFTVAAGVVLIATVARVSSMNFPFYFVALAAFAATLAAVNASVAATAHAVSANWTVAAVVAAFLCGMSTSHAVK